MAHLWMKNEAAGWAVLPLEEDRLRIDADPPRRLRDEVAGTEDATGILLLRERMDEGAVWILLAGPAHDVRINGLPLAAGIRVLADRDEIRIAGRPHAYFSSEESPRVVPFPEHDRPICCARCQREITPGQAAVRCPICGVWHHQMPEEAFPCWTYADLCGGCRRQETKLEAEFRWTPDGL